MRRDKNIREYYIDAKITSSTKSAEYISMSDIMNSGENIVDLSLYDFETGRVDGLTQNILNDYIPWFNGSNKNTQWLVFDNYSARHFEYKSWAICKWLYANTELYHLIYALNDIEHDSDLSYDYLITHRLKVPSAQGLDSLKKLLQFKERVETSDGNASFYVDEM